ncbi:type I pullulanase [Mycoplasmatota bacterium]|nr:type I pullulanase [Mycoplasmatota bacterium]
MIRIESDQYIYQISLDDNQLEWQKNENGSQYFATKKDIDLHLNEMIYINEKPYKLELGIVTLTDAFDKKYRYDGPLGYIYHKTHTDFVLFSPVAKEVKVIIDGISYDMTYDMPVWKTTVSGDLDSKSYLYDIRLYDTFKKVRDPYANAATPEANMIIDFNKTYQMKKTPIKVKNNVDAVIYEGHVRDMSVTLDVEHPGTFDGLAEESCQLGQSVLSYVKKLGMTHLQLLPIYDFELVDEIEKDKKYNWGYNPSQYFVLEGWFSKNPNDPYDRINSLKKTIEKAHKLKLGINMDVVYNHVFNHETFPYDDIVPGYFYRHDGFNQMTNGSFCGNEIETRHYMVRRLIVDSLVHYAKQFQMDGFRFDLMGLLDLDTMALIEEKLKEVNPYIMLYGEGWNMQTEIPSKHRANMNNQSKFQYYAHFNDFYRNTMKGDLNTDELGFAMGGNTHKKAMKSIVGSPHMFTNPNQSINYVECHDNLTFYDRMIKNHGFELPDFKVVQDFVNHMIAISQGIPFYHAGQEFYRSKKGDENSYESSDHINKILWRPYEQSVKQLRKLLKIRKRYKLYRLNQYDQNQVKIEKADKLIIYTLEDKDYKLIHYIKNYFTLEKLPLNEGKLIFPSQKAITEKNQLFIDQPGIYIIEIKK